MLLLSADVRAQLERRVRAGYPHETCGLLVGSEQDGGIQVRRAVQARNLVVERARDRYELDPLDHMAADREARAHGLALVGVWHSHPDHPAVPSETDRASAWEGWSYLILSVSARGVEALRSWRLSGGVFQEEEVRSKRRAVIRIPTPLRSYAKGRDEVPVECATVSEALMQLGEQAPGILEHVLDRGGKLRPFVNVFLGSRDVRTLQGLESAVPDGAVISILPAVAGGLEGA
jgi:proteasome lid subunit RPN8/RPN11/molybdopterin converting factor small subunit